MKQTVAFSSGSINVFFHILTACNLHCRHCYINPKQHGTQTLSFDTIAKWLNAFAHKSRNTNVIFLGGEPTLHPDLAQAVKYAKQLGYQSVTVDTNGYLFHDFLSKVTPDELDYISFSLDGATRETNDRIRGKGAYDACLAGIRKAVAHNFHTSVIYTVSRENIHELPHMGALLADLAIHRFFIQVIGLRGESAPQNNADDTRLLPVSGAEWRAVVPKIAERIARDNRIIVTYPKVFLEDAETFECAGNVAENYFIFPNGRVYQCPLCEDFPLHSNAFVNDRLVQMPPINEQDLFKLTIPEGCVMNRLVQPENLQYAPDGSPAYRIACCLLKEEISNG